MVFPSSLAKKSKWESNMEWYKLNHFDRIWQIADYMMRQFLLGVDIMRTYFQNICSGSHMIILFQLVEWATSAADIEYCLMSSSNDYKDRGTKAIMYNCCSKVHLIFPLTRLLNFLQFRVPHTMSRYNF